MSIRSESPKRLRALLLLGCGMTLAASACTNNLSTRATSSREVNADDPLAEVITDLGKSTLVLSRVVKNSTAPSTVFDLVGDGSGAMGTQCLAQSATSEDTNVGPSTCNCSYTYTKPDGSVENFEKPTLYHESNLIRCDYIGIPAAVSSVKIKVHVVTTDTYSNEVTFKLNGTGTSLDTALASTFAKVDRYQCRHMPTVPLPGYSRESTGMVYDRFQSEDPTNTYPLNFYTTNMGGTLAIFAAGAGNFAAPLEWNCPAIPNDPNEGADLRLYSVASHEVEVPKSDGTKYARAKKQIYPPLPGAFDRTNFHLARKPTGIFTVPVNAYISPEIFSSTPSSDEEAALAVLPLGYGASPMAGAQPGIETCPDSSISIPRGYHWVKVWLFRMALNPRKYLQSQRFANLGEIRCNPGLWRNQSGLAGISRYAFHDCANSTSIHDLDQYPAGTLASRAFWSYPPRCVRPSPGGTLGNAAFAGFNFAEGTDVLTPNGGFASEAAFQSMACKAGLDPTDYAHVCAQNAAYDEAPITGYIDATQGSSGSVIPFSRYDYLFVVTPPTVMSKDMSNTASSVAAAYTPYRFLTPSDCIDPGTGLPYADPDAAGCDPKRSLRNYGVKFHEVGTAGDPPADNPNRPGSFPVCALQPDAS